MFGLLVELGPLQLNDASMLDPVYNTTGIPQLIYNEFSWSKFAHLLIIDFPPPVGFSFCNPPGPAGGGPSCGAWNDTSTTMGLLFFDNSKKFSFNCKRFLCLL